MARVYNETSIRGKLVAKGKPVDSGVSSTSFPTDFKDKFVARLRDTNIDPKKGFGVFSNDVYSNEESEEFINEKLPTFDNNPNFADKQSNRIAKGFLNKYKNSFIQPPKEKVSAESTKGFILGDPNTNLAKKYPQTQELS